MTTLILTTITGIEIKFRLFLNEAPVTCNEMARILPVEISLLHAKTSGEEIWTPDGPELNIGLENATTNIEAGEIGIAPIHPRNKISKCLVISYGQAKLYDCANIFGKVGSDDEENLKALGNSIWKEGKQTVKLKIK